MCPPTHSSQSAGGMHAPLSFQDGALIELDNVIIPLRLNCLQSCYLTSITLICHIGQTMKELSPNVIIICHIRGLFQTSVSFFSLPPPLSPRNSSSSDIGAVHTPAPTEADNLPGIAASKEKQPPSPHSPGSPHTSLLLSRAQTGYVAVLLLVQVYCEFLHSFGPLRRFQFLPLLLTSVSCAVAVVWSWGHFLTLFLMH